MTRKAPGNTFVTILVRKEVAVEWKLHEAKARFSELVQRAVDEGPQTVTRRGKASVVVLSAEQYELMQKRQIDFKEFLAAIPLDGVESERDRSPPRDVDL